MAPHLPVAPPAGIAAREGGLANHHDDSKKRKPPLLNLIRSSRPRANFVIPETESTRRLAALLVAEDVGENQSVNERHQPKKKKKRTRATIETLTTTVTSGIARADQRAANKRQRIKQKPPSIAANGSAAGPGGGRVCKENGDAMAMPGTSLADLAAAGLHKKNKKNTASASSVRTKSSSGASSTNVRLPTSEGMRQHCKKPFGGSSSALAPRVTKDTQKLLLRENPYKAYRADVAPLAGAMSAASTEDGTQTNGNDIQPAFEEGKAAELKFPSAGADNTSTNTAPSAAGCPKATTSSTKTGGAPPVLSLVGNRGGRCLQKGRGAGTATTTISERQQLRGNCGTYANVAASIGDGSDNGPGALILPPPVGANESIIIPSPSSRRVPGRPQAAAGSATTGSNTHVSSSARERDIRSSVWQGIPLPKSSNAGGTDQEAPAVKKSRCKNGSIGGNFVRLNMRNSAGACRGARNKKPYRKSSWRNRRSDNNGGSYHDQGLKADSSFGFSAPQLQPVHQSQQTGTDPLDDYLDGVYHDSIPKEKRAGNKKSNKTANSRNPLPMCSGHQRPCKLLQVKKKNDNRGRHFYACSLPRGEQCNHFQWAEDTVQARCHFSTLYESIMTACTLTKCLTSFRLLFFDTVGPGGTAEEQVLLGIHCSAGGVIYGSDSLLDRSRVARPVQAPRTPSDRQGQ